MKTKVKKLCTILTFCLAFVNFACKTEIPEVATDTTAPAEVANLTVTATNTNAILSWTNPSDDDFAGVKINASPAEGTLANAIILEKGIRSFIVSGLTNGTAYSFTVQTYDTSLNYSKGSSKTVIMKDKKAPANVTSLSVQAVNTNAILSWTNPSDDDFAGVKISAIPAEGTLANAVILEKNITSFSVSGLTTGSEYTFTVQSFDTSMNYSTGTSKVATVSDTSDKTAPAEVSNLTAQNLDGAVLLTWTDPSDEDLFGIEITYTSNTNTLSRAISAMQEGSIFIAPKTQSAIIPNLTNSKTYTFTLKTMDLSGNKSSGKTASITPTAIQGNAMQITLTPSTTEITNQNVDVNILITTDATSISTVKYESGNQNISYFTSSGTEIVADSNGAYSFTASKNGTYTVYVFDSDGRRETQTVKIENIDKTSPIKVVNLMAVYDYGHKKITVTWDTSDTDIDYYLISYNLGDETKESDVKLSTKTYTLENIDAGTNAYTFTVKAVDKAGNEGSSNSTNITPEAAPLVSSIKLDRYHIAYNDSDLSINVTVYGSNFDLISSKDDTSFKIQVVDSSNSVTNYDATVNTTNNTATATITAPSLILTTVAGTDYTIRAKVCGTIDKEHTATLNISKAAAVSSISLSTSQISVEDVTSGLTTTATVTGTNFDVAGTITLQLYSSTNTAYGDAITVSTSDFEMHQTSFTAQVPIPTVNDIYTLKVLFDETAQSETSSLQVYGSPVFTSFKIPKAGISKQDNTLTATVKGKNFTAPNVTAESFTVTCSENSSITSDSKVKILSDSMLSITLTIPSTASDYKVKIASGSKYLENTFTVKDYSDYEDKIGYIILADGSLADSSSYTAIDTNNPPVAVVAGFNGYGVVSGVGLHWSEKQLEWATSGTTGYNTKFEDIICTPSTTSNGATNTATFTGDTYGGDNWDVICSVDPEGSADAAINYPAFNWANTYGETYKDYLGGVTEGWYMPSIAELCYVYRNLSSINKTLSVVNSINNKYAVSSLASHFWSSSEYYFSYSDVWLVHFYDGYVVNDGRGTTNVDVLVIRAF